MKLLRADTAILRAAIATLVMSAAPGALAKTIYVNTAGNDAWTGASPIIAAPTGPKRNIQTAIIAAAANDIISVASGAYHENIDTEAKAITITAPGGPGATSIIGDANPGTPTVSCITGETRATVIERFTITGASSSRTNGVGPGSGLSIVNASPTIRACTIAGNTGSGAGGAAVFNSSALFECCTFRQNTSTGPAGALRLANGGSPVVNSCIFDRNSAATYGGAISVFVANTTIVNCTFSLNHCSQIPAGGAIDIDGSAVVSITNSILWGDTVGANPSEIYVSLGTATVKRSIVQGGAAGSSNTQADPGFTNASTGDLRPAPGSPAIDSGDNTAVPAATPTDASGNSRFIDAVNYSNTNVPDGVNAPVDRGALEAAAATPPPCPDIDNNGVINTLDLVLLLQKYGQTVAPGNTEPADLNHDGFINTLDLTALLQRYGQSCS